MNTALQSYPLGTTVKNAHSTGFYFDSKTSEPVKQAIAYAYSCELRVRIFLGDIKTGKAWAKENDVIGTIGRSMGPCKVPLLIHNARSHGGGALLDSCIVAVFHTGAGHAIYKHPSFNPGLWTVAPADLPDYLESAFCDGVLHASFKKPEQAERYCAFMSGTRFSK